MGRSDALLADGHRRRDTLASQLACYADDARAVEKLRKELPANAQASLATRFLIELAAESPEGSGRISDALFDQWLAAACEIISLGMACDVQHLQLAEVTLHLHPNGYVIGRGAYGEGAHAVQEAAVASAIEIVTEPDHEFDPSTWPFPTKEQIDEASEAELGCSLSEIDRLPAHVSHIVGERDESVVEMPVQELIPQLCSRLAWDEDKVNAVLQSLTLEARTEFTKAASPYSASDVLPWRFNRALSYLRRPLIRVIRGDHPHLFLAAGAPVASAEHLVERARVQASGPLVCGRLSCPASGVAGPGCTRPQPPVLVSSANGSVEARSEVPRC